MGGACGERVLEYCRGSSGRGISRCAVEASDCGGPCFDLSRELDRDASRRDCADA